jgi:hypothetical protein
MSGSVGPVIVVCSSCKFVGAFKDADRVGWEEGIVEKLESKVQAYLRETSDMSD